MRTRAAAAVAGLVLGTGLLLLPSSLKLPRSGKTQPGEPATLDEAVALCRQSGLQGWDLVTFAQRQVYRRFRYYSTRNLLDTPRRAFARGMGYCTQYNLALKNILEQLGFETQIVHCMQVRIPAQPEWTLGHTWLRVRWDGHVRDVCAGSPDNLPGAVCFVPVRRVHTASYLRMMLLQAGMIPFCGVVEWTAILTGKGDPGWTLVKRPETP